MKSPLFLSAVTTALLAAPGVSQILPGHSIATVIPTGQPSEMYDIDHQAGTATALTLSPAFAGEALNCVLMTSSVTGFVGTNATGNIYSILVTNNTVTETLLNTTPSAGGNVAQLALLNNRIYYCTQTAGVLGSLQSIPDTGGPVTLELDLANLGATGLANACAVIGNKVFVATFNSSPANTATSPGELFELDTGVIPPAARLVLNLPPGGFAPLANPWNTGIVNMTEDPMQAGILVLQGVYGDLLRIDPVTSTVVSSTWTGILNATGNALASGTVNSFSFDPVAQDWIIGTRYAAIERWVGNQQAENQILGVGTNPTLTSNSISGIYHFPATGGSDVSYGAGCPGNDGWTPTDSSYGAPTAGNLAFRLGLFSANPGNLVVLLVDFQNVAIGGLTLPVDLSTYGAPGCFIRTGNLISTFLLTTGTGPGNGQASVAVPLPAWTLGLNLYHQWAELQVTPTNALGLVTSNARQSIVQ